MEFRPKGRVWDTIIKDLSSIHKRHEEMSTRLSENTENQREYLRALFDQLLLPSSTPVVTKTPKITRKRGLQRIETIPEDDILEQENITANATQVISEKEKDTDSIAGGRTKRIASLKAVNNIAKQSLLMQNSKLVDGNVSAVVKKVSSIYFSVRYKL